MKKIYSLILMLALLCMSWTAKAQETLTVYEGTTTSYFVPAYMAYFDDFSRSQFVIPASDIAEMDGGTISSITFYTSDYNVPYTSVSTVDVYIMEVNNTTISALEPKESASIVYQGTLDIVTAGDGGQLTIEFTDPYVYNGGNLLIGIDNTTDAGYKFIYFYGQTVSGASLAGYNSSSLANVTGSQQNFIPTTTFEYTPAGVISCTKPTALTATVTPGQGTIANLTWNENGTATDWVIEYGTAADFSNATTVNASGTPAHILTGLSPETTYYAHVKADCGGSEGQSSWSSTVSFKPSNIFNITLYDGSGLNSYIPLYGYYVDGYAKGQFIIPASDLTDLAGATINQLTFYNYYSNLTWENAIFDVRLKEVGYTAFPSTTLEDWDGMDLAYSGSLSVSNNSMTITFTTPYTYEGGNLMIGINTTTAGTYTYYCSWYGTTQSNNTAAYGYINYYGTNTDLQQFLPKVTIDFTPGTPSTCPKPTNLTASEVSAHSAVLNWTENGTATAWQICINDDEANLINASNTSYTLTGLTAETAYSVKVRSVCGGEDGESNWATVNFSTTIACPAPTSLAASNITGSSANLSWSGSGENYNVRYRVPANTEVLFSDDFENGLTGWTLVDADGDGFNWQNHINNGENDLSPHSGIGVVFSESYSNDASMALTPDNWLISPQIQLGGSVSFWAMGQDDDYAEEHFAIYVSTTGTNPSDFTSVSNEYIANSYYTQYSADLSNFSGMGYVAIRHFNVTDMFILNIDDFVIYGEPTPAGEWMTASSTTTAATITGLAPLTTYEVQVMSNCGEDGTSEWSSSYIFTTTELLCSAPSNLVISDTTTTGATLAWTETGSANAWQISLNNDEENLINVTENSTYTFSGLTTGTEYAVKVRANCGETTSDWSENATFTTKAEIIPTVIIISGDTAACPGQYTTLTASTDVEATYAWSNGDNTAATSLTQGTYTVTVTSTTGNQLTKAVTVIEYPTYETHEDITICASELPYDWHGSNVVEPGNYYKSLPTVHGCDSAFYMTLTVNPTYEINDTKTICDNELPYLWNGVTFTEAGTQTVTLTSSLECDSVVTMTLIVNPVVYGVDGWTICASDLPYEWNGVTFTEAGTQNATLDAVNGCDSVVTMTLTVNPTFNTPLTAEICQGGSYEFAGNTLSEAGVYTDTLQAENGCDSIITLTLTVNLPTEGTLNASVSVYNLPYILNGQSYDSTGVYTQTLTNAAGCDSTLTLTLIVLNSILTDIDSTICANVLPLVWNNVTFTEAGEQSATFVAANGADSIVTMHLAVNPTFEVTDAKAICESSLPYTWNGVTFTEAGTQSVILQTVNGCDSVVTMTLTVNPVYEVNDAVTICASELPYEWNGIEFSEAGTLPVTLHSVNGCDSVVIMTLTVKQTYNVTENRAICMNELPYEWNGVTFTGAGIEHVTLTAANGCDSAVTMHLTINPIYSTPIIANICEGESYEFFGQQLTESGVYNDTLPTINGCDSIFTLTLNVYPTYNTPITYTMCQGETCVFYGETLSEAGVYTHTLNSSHGCDSVITLTLTVNPTFNTPVAETICEGEYHNFFGQNLNVAGTYTHTLQTVAGCDSVITLTLTVNPTYNTPVTEAICEGESYNFFGQSLTTAGTYTHTLQAVTGCDSVITLTLIVNPIFNTPVTATICQNEIYNFFGQSLTTAGTYTHTLQAVTGCDSVITLTLTVNPTYTTLLSEAICEGESYDFFGQSLTTAGTYNHTLQAVTGCDSVITLTLIVNPTFNTPVTETICQGDSYNFFGQSLTTAGTYTHTLTAVTGCDSVITLTLNVNPSFNTPISATICQGETYNFFDQSLTAAGTYSHTLQAVTGCDSVITLTLNVNPSFSTLIDEAICQGETYNFFGQSLTTEGTYNHTLQAVTGCDSVIILNLTINPTFNVTDSKTVCESELPYTWNGVTFTEAGTQNVTLQALSGCDSVVVMTLTVNPTYNVTESQAVCEGELPITWNGVEFTAAGTQNVTLTAANGCDSVVVMTLTVNLNVTSEFTIETPDSCYEWNGQLYCASGDYTQTLTTEAGCDSVVTLHLTTSVGVDSHEHETNVYIAPNPAKNVCRILGLSTEPKFVEIYDMRGGLVMRINDTEFDVRTLSTGLYMVKVYTGERVINLKLVKE